MLTRNIRPSCSFDCEMIVGPDASEENQEIRKIYDETLVIFLKHRYIDISIADFKNASGETIGEYLLNNQVEFAEALSKKE